MLKLSDYNVTFYDSADKVVCSCSYNDREIAKDLGFFWDKENKIWAMERKYFIHLIPYIKRNYNIEDNSYAVEVEGNEIIYCKFARMPVVVLISEPYAEAVICPFKYKDELKEIGFTWEPALKLWVMDSYDFECFADDYPELFIDTNDVSGISLEYNDLLHVDEFLDIEENTDIDLGKALSLLKKDVVPYGYQKEGISYILSKKYCLLTDEMGCVDGDAIVTVKRAGCSRKMKLSDLCFKFNGGISHGNKAWDENIPTEIRCYYDGSLRSMPISKVWESGYKEVLKIFLDDGKELICTPEHQVLTEHGWVEAQYLLNKNVLTNGNECCLKCGSTDDIITYKKSLYAGYCRSCMYFYRDAARKATADGVIRKDGYRYIYVGKSYPNYKKQGIAEHRLVVEANLNGYSYKEYRELIAFNKNLSKFNLKIIPPDFEVHHKNGIRLDNRLDNLELKTKYVHHAEHESKNIFNKIKIFKPKKIKCTAIKRLGKKTTYDVRVPYADSFVANGIIVHNCGKSLQALTSSLPYIDNKVLVICPAFLKYNWRAEYLKFSDVPEKRILLAKNKKEVGRWDTNNYDVLIINYEMLRSGVLNDIFNDFGMVILDECHYLKEPTAQRTESFLYLMEQHKPEFLVGLTGTPVQNRVPEFYTLLKLMSMCPSKTNGKKITDSFMTYSSFCERFSYKKLKKFRGMRQAIVKYEGSKNIKELKEYLKGKFIRRMAKDHLDLPEFSHQNILVELTKKALTEISESLRLAWEEQVIDSEGDEEESFSTAKARAALAKAPAVVNFTDDLLQQEPDSPVVIFSDHRESVDFMFEALSKKKKSVARIYGGTPNAKRHKIVKDFQAGKLDVLVATIGAAGTGLTLTKSNKMIFCDLNWVPGQNAQAEKRIHRVGQKNRCMYYHFILPGIDEMISSSLQEKIETINKVI